MNKYVDGINAEAMDQFLKALESGKYVQGSHRLHTAEDDSMCCLGVATVELGPQCGVFPEQIEEDFDGLSRFYKDAEGNRYYLLMPPVVTALLGIPAQFIEPTGSGDAILVDVEDGDHDFDDYSRDGRRLVAVSALNDSGTSFSEIARRIRETLSVKED